MVEVTEQGALFLVQSLVFGAGADELSLERPGAVVPVDDFRKEGELFAPLFLPVVKLLQPLEELLVLVLTFAQKLFSFLQTEEKFLLLCAKLGIVEGVLVELLFLLEQMAAFVDAPHRFVLCPQGIQLGAKLLFLLLLLL